MKTLKQKIEKNREKINSINWETTKSSEDLNSLYRLTIEGANLQKEFYENKLFWRRVVSYILRGSSLLFGLIGIILPLIPLIAGAIAKDQNTSQQLNLAYGGYVAIAVATAILATDTMFSISRGLARYITTILLIDNIVADLGYAWARDKVLFKNSTITSEQTISIITALQVSTNKVLDEVSKETGLWATDLEAGLKALTDTLSNRNEQIKTQLSEINATATKQLEEAKLGAIQIHLTNVSSASEKIKIVAINNQTKLQVGDADLTPPSDTYCIENLTPGLHNIKVTCEIKGKIFSTSNAVLVKPKEIVELNITLPLP